MRDFYSKIQRYQPTKFLALALLLAISTLVAGRNTFWGSRASTNDTVVSPTATLAPIGQVTKKVLVLDFDPLINTVPLHTYKSWSDPITLQNKYLTEVKDASNQYVNYQIVNTQVIRDYPVKTGGFKFTQSAFLGCLTGAQQSYCNDMIDYNKLLSDYHVCDQVNSGAIDELWLWGAPYFGYYESVMAGPNAFFLNGPVITGTACNKKLPIMGFNYDAGSVQMMHSLGHRIEYSMVKAFNSIDLAFGYAPNLSNLFERFGVYNNLLSNKSACGTVHFTPNSTFAYDYRNNTSVSSNCDDWLNFPSTSGRSANLTCFSWNPYGSGTCTHDLNADTYYEKWWVSHIPHAVGTLNGKFNNWWRYVMDYDDAVAKAPLEKERWYSIHDGGRDYNTSCSLETSNNEVYLGINGACNQNYIAKFDFPEIQIPKNANIVDAYLEFVTDGVYTNPITENISLTDDTTTTNAVSWPINETWTSESVVKSPKITSIVQQMVNSSSWTSGKTMKVNLTHVSGSGARRVFAFEREPLAGARLVIKAEVPVFADVPFGSFGQKQIESVYNAGITGGCSANPLKYCPDTGVTRAQMAIFLLKAKKGASYTPPSVGASTGFSDVPTSYWAASWVKQFAAEGITGGCGTGIFCPDGAVTRAQMAVFLLKVKYGSSYAPPSVGTSTGFADVATSYWAASWIKQFAALGITGGCGNGNYCPDGVVTRAQMAIFLTKMFNLP
jgi:hypothetical protein